MENRGNRPGSQGRTQTQNPMQPPRAGTNEGQSREELEEEESGNRREEEEESTSIRQDRGSPSGNEVGSQSPNRGSPSNPSDRGRNR